MVDVVESENFKSAFSSFSDHGIAKSLWEHGDSSEPLEDKVNFYLMVNPINVFSIDVPKHLDFISFKIIDTLLLKNFRSEIESF